MATLKKKLWGVVVNPHFYKFYAKVIDKSLHVLPSPSFDAHEVYPNLYVGDIWAAYNLEELKKRKITHVVTAVLGIDPIYPQEFKYLNVQIRDVEEENICDHFEEVIKFIDEGRATGNVFVHCLRGVSRSATIAAAYVMHHKHVTQEEAIILLREKRQVINPNPSFLKQLDSYYELITTTTTTTATPTEVTTETTTEAMEIGSEEAAGGEEEISYTITSEPVAGVVEPVASAVEPVASYGGNGEVEVEATTETTVAPKEGEEMNAFTTVSEETADGPSPTTLIIHEK